MSHESSRTRRGQGSGGPGAEPALRTRSPAALSIVLLLAWVCLGGVAAGAEAPDSSLPREGTASWYGEPFHGRLTASGVVFDKEGFSAAHKTLPFGTVLAVTNLSNGKKTVVVVNDRGPFVLGRELDVSEAAARVLGMIGSGTARVRYELAPPGAVVPGKAASAPLATPAPVVGVRYRIQAASFKDRDNAERSLARLASAGLKPRLERAPDSGALRVILDELDEAAFRHALSILSDLGYREPLVTKSTPK